MGSLKSKSKMSLEEMLKEDPELAEMLRKGREEVARMTPEQRATRIRQLHHLAERYLKRWEKEDRKKEEQNRKPST